MGAKIKTQKNSHVEFPSHKNFQKALNDITITNLQIILNAQINPYSCTVAIKQLGLGTRNCSQTINQLASNQKK